jgi:uncharacterized protein YbjT (DUF2867 family)
MAQGEERLEGSSFPSCSAFLPLKLTLIPLPSQVYIAPHNGPTQYTDETEFHLALKNAGVKHVVRVSTLTHYVHAHSPVYYGRSHWAVEQFLDALSKTDSQLEWTSLQPNFFTSMYGASAAEWIKEYRKTGKKTTLKLIPDEHTSVAIMDPSDVGAVGAAILALDDDARKAHYGQRYVLAGPVNVSGREIVNAVEKITGTTVDDVLFADTSVLEFLGQVGVFEKRLIPSVATGCGPLWDGTSSREGAGNSPAVVQLAEPKRTIEDAHRAMTQE